MDSKVLEKIKKLLRLSKSSNINEARLALQKAQELMAKHNIVVDLNQEEEETVIESIVEQTTKTISFYRQEIAAVLAKHFRVEILITYPINGGSKIKVIGRPQEVEIYKEVLNWSCIVFNKLFKDFLKVRGSQSRSESLRVRNDYLFGFTSGLKDALIENENAHSLVVVTPDCVVKYMNSLNLCIAKKRNISSFGDFEARQTGYRDGRESQRMKNRIVNV